MKKISILIIIVYTLLAKSVWAQGNIVRFSGSTSEQFDRKTLLRFEKYACKGDSIIAFKDNDCYYSYNKGADWGYTNIRNQLLLDEGMNYGIVPREIFIRNNDVIIFALGKFFKSTDFGKTFSRISSNKSLKVKSEIPENDISGYHDVILSNGFYIILCQDGIFKSKDCNKWEKLKVPEGIVATKLTSYKNDIYIATLKNIYKSSDYGDTWEKLDFIVFKWAVDAMRAYGGCQEMIVFDNKLYLRLADNAPDLTYVYDLVTKTETQVKNISSVFVKNDILYLHSQYNIEGNKIIDNGEIFYYVNSLQKSNIELPKMGSTEFQYKYGTKKFQLSNSYIILDGEASLSITQNTIKKSTGCISGDCYTGIGTYLFPKGEKYVGEFKNGTYNGKGTFSWPNGQTYAGGWKDGAQNGFGTFTYSNGKTETGEWENNNLLNNNTSKNESSSFISENSKSINTNKLNSSGNQLMKNCDLSKEGLKGNITKIETSIYDISSKKNIFFSKREFNEFGKIKSITSDSDFSDEIENFEIEYMPKEFDEEFLVVLPFCRTKFTLHIGNRKELAFGGSTNLAFEYDSEGKLVSVGNMKFVYDAAGNLIEKNYYNTSTPGGSPTADGSISKIKYKWQNGKLVSKYEYNNKGDRYDEFYDIEYNGNQQIITEFEMKDVKEVFYTLESKNDNIISKSKGRKCSVYSGYEPIIRNLSSMKYIYDGKLIVKIICEENDFLDNYRLSVKFGLNPNAGILEKSHKSEIKIKRDTHGNILYIEKDNYGRNQFEHKIEWTYEYDMYENWIKRTEYDVKNGDIKITKKIYEVSRKITYN